MSARPSSTTALTNVITIITLLIVTLMVIHTNGYKYS